MNCTFVRATFERATVAIRAAAIAFLIAAASPVAAQTAPTKFIPTFLMYYGAGPALVAADAAKLAKFDLLEFDRSRHNNIGANTWAAIKALNPNAQIYLYEMGPETPSHLDGTAQMDLNGLGRHNVSRGHPQGSLNGNNPALFQLNAAGNRIHNLVTSNPAANQYWYLMDFGSSAYQAYWLEAVKTDIVNQPWVADGVFADNCMTSAGTGTYSNTSAWYSTNASWSAAMNTFARTTTAGLHGLGQKLWCNRGESKTADGSAAWQTLDNSASPPDVLLEEGAFAVQWGSANTQFYTEAEWKRQVDIMGAIKNSKVAMLSHTKLLEGQAGTDNFGKPVTYWQTLWYSLGSFLLGKNDQLNNAHFMFSGGSGYNKIWWHDEYDRIDLGKAIGPYAVRTIGSAKVYWREFEKGYVYVNPSAFNATSVSLPQTSKRLTHGNLLSPLSSIANVNAIGLGSHAAAILLKTDTTAPSVPTGLTGTVVSATQINLSWTASTDNVAVTGYRVYRGGALITTLGNVTTFQNTGLTASTAYTYTVQAIDAAGNASAQSTAASATTPAAGSPGTVSNLSASVTSNSATLSFTEVNDGTGLPAKYDVRFNTPAISWGSAQRVTSGTCATPLQGTSIGATKTCTVTGLASNITYQFQLVAYSGTLNAGAVFGGLSNIVAATTPSTSDTTAPSVPTGLTGTAASATQINLSWTASTDNVAVTGYRVYRGGALITTLGNVTTFQNTGLTASTAYTYTVQAIDAAGNASAQSTAASATTPAAADTTAPSVPTGLTGTVVSATQINLSWTASTDNVAVTGYRVYRGGALITTLGNVTTFQNTGLTASTAYTYTVQAIDAAGNASAQSTAASATTPAAADTTAPSVPTGLTGTVVSATQINLSWTASTDNVAVTGYRVYRGGALITTLGNVTTFQNTGLTASTAYTYTVQAIDAAGNASAQSTAASATTPAAGSPGTVSNLSASVTSNSATLSFTEVNDGTGLPAKYDVRFNTPAISWGSAQRVTSGTCATPLQGTSIGATKTCTVTGLASNITYQFQLVAYSGTLNAGAVFGGLSNIVAATTPSTSDTTAPSVPTGLTGTAASATQINLSWTASTDNVAVTGYRVYRGGALITTLGNVTTFQNTGLTASTAYTYTVQAIDAAGNASAQSTAASATTPAAADTTAPSVPTGLTGTVVSATQINLSWTASTDNVAVTGYRVERCLGAGCVNFAQVGTPIGTSFSNPGLTAGTSYRYRVRAADAAGNLSGYSAVVTATTSSAPPAGTATLAWDAVTAANLSGYRIYYGTAPGTYLQPLGQGVNVGNATTYAVTGLSGGTRYYFVVTAFDTSNNESAFSNEVFKDIP